MFPEDTEGKGAAASDENIPSSPAKESLPPGTMARVDLDQALLRGPGWLLSRIQTEEVLRQNKFVGWRLISFPAEWDGSGLQPGDVITDVNGVVVERPDDMWTAWINLASAPDLRIAFERDGKPAVTILKIQGEPQAQTKKQLESGVVVAGPPPAAQQGAPKSKPLQSKGGKARFDTKVIGGDAAEPTETSDY